MISIGWFTCGVGTVVLAMIIMILLDPQMRTTTTSDAYTFVINHRRSTLRQHRSSCTNTVVVGSKNSCLMMAPKQGTANNQYSPLPRGISPFQRSTNKNNNKNSSQQDTTTTTTTVGGGAMMDEFIRLSNQALARALADGQVLMEVDFPPNLLQSKSQFDDYDNLSELDTNRDFVVRLATALRTGSGGGGGLPAILPFTSSARPSTNTRPSTIWLIFPDDQECALAQQAWQGQPRFQQSALFTSIRAALSQVAGEGQVVQPWGTAVAVAMNKLTGGDGILASDSSLLDDLSASSSSTATNRLQLICQPGNGGPVEDWINIARLHQASTGKASTCIVNGALDKVRDGYYPSVFFPSLARTGPFYKEVCPVWVLKPLSDKGVYGWLYRSYPEPWQVILETVKRQELKSNQKEQYSVQVQEHVAMVSERRPTYQEAIQALVRTALQLA